MNCQSCSNPEALKWNKAFNKGFKPRKGIYQVNVKHEIWNVCKSCYALIG